MPARRAHFPARLTAAVGPGRFPTLAVRWWCDDCQALHAAPWPSHHPGVRQAELSSPCVNGRRRVRLRLARYAERENERALAAYRRAVFAEAAPIRFRPGRETAVARQADVETRREWWGE